MRAWLRIIGLLLVLAWYLSRLMLLSFIFGETEKRGFLFRRKFARAAMRVLGVRLTMDGSPVKPPVLYVSNHRSLLDPVIELGYIDAYIVSKSEVERYPLVGRGARETGVVFVQRDSKESRLASRETIRNLLAEGKSVMIYPEGTTSALPTTRDFRMGAFNIAAELHVPVVPVVIQYGEEADHWADGPMLPFFIRKFSKRKIQAFLLIGTVIEGTDPKQLMTTSRDWINARLLQYPASKK